MASSFEIVQFLVRSDNRVTVLASLATGASLTRAEIQHASGIPRSTVSRILSELGGRRLVSRAGHRYEVTPLGELLARRLDSMFDSIEAMQRLQTLLGQFPDTVPDITFTDDPGSEILTPTSSDPGGPARRWVDLLQAAVDVRMIVPAVIPVLFDLDSTFIEGMQTFDVVVPHVALEMERNGATSAQQRRDVNAPGAMTLFAYDGDIPYVAGTFDEIAVVGLTDSEGTIRAYIETSDRSVHSRTEALVEAYQQNAERVAN